MDKLVLTRYKDAIANPVNGLAGTLEIYDLRLFTIEKPWVYSKTRWPFGKPGASCIPTGEYELNMSNDNILYLSNNSLGVYIDGKQDGKKRIGISLHPALNIFDIDGGIAVGSGIVLSGTPSLTGTKVAKDFLDQLYREVGIRKIEITERSLDESFTKNKWH